MPASQILKFVLAASGALALASPARAQPADLLIWGGPIYTNPTPAKAAAVAVAVQDGRIVFVGSRAGAETHLREGTEVVDLKGAACSPASRRPRPPARHRRARAVLNLEGSKSAAEAVARVKAYLAERQTIGPAWDRGWIETGWPEGRFLEKGDLDPIAPDRPVLLVLADGHAGKRADLSGFSVDLMTAPEAAIPKGHAVLTVVEARWCSASPSRLASTDGG